MALSRERFLRLVLRVIGSAGLTAVIFVFAPYAWMDAIHRRLGMGRLPDDPVVGYLARSTSGFYASFGGLLWLLSFDVQGRRLVLCYLGGVFTFFGLVLLGIDLVEGLPLWWALAEGLSNAAVGVVIFCLSWRLGHADTRTAAGDRGDPAAV